MARRTKLEIQKANTELLKKKQKALADLNEHLDEINDLTDEELNKINTFINLFLKCETVYKTLYPAFKKLKDGKVIDVRQLKFNIQYFEAALRYFGIEHDHDVMMKMFAADNSYLKLRDNILHGLKIESINKVLEKYDEMAADMINFLNNVANGQPSI